MEPIQKFNTLTNKYMNTKVGMELASHSLIAFRPIINEDQAPKILVECLHFTVELLFIKNALT